MIFMDVLLIQCVIDLEIVLKVLYFEKHIFFYQYNILNKNLYFCLNQRTIDNDF